MLRVGLRRTESAGTRRQTLKICARYICAVARMRAAAYGVYLRVS